MSQTLAHHRVDTPDPISASDPPKTIDTAAVRRYGWVRVGFGLIWGIDATFKWLPGFRHDYPSMITDAAHGQPGWLHGWFSLWGNLIAGSPTAFAVLIALAETAISLSLLFGIAQRIGFTLGIAFAMLIWGVGEGFGGPYNSGVTDIGAAVMYAVMLAGLWLAVPRTVRAAAPAIDHRLVHHRQLRWATFN